MSDASSLQYDLEWENALDQRLGVSSDFPMPLHRMNSLIIKAHLGPSEIAAMQFSRQNTSIPLPRIHHPRDDLLLMDFIEGRMLYECWETLSHFMRFRIACTLRLYIKQMRALRGPGIGAIDDGHVRGILFEENVYARFLNPSRFCRFCENVAYDGWRTRALHHQIRTGIVPALPCPDLDWTPVFIHGDLNSSNILLDCHGGLWVIDWGTSGFYPASMESCAMRLVDDILRPDILTSWSGYRSFIAGRTPEAEEQFWHDFYSAIHRFPS
jgi:serine/threonine protein kinase